MKNKGKGAKDRGEEDIFGWLVIAGAIGHVPGACMTTPLWKFGGAWAEA